MSAKTKDQGSRLPPPPKRPHIYNGNPRDPYCPRCHRPIRQLERECRGAPLPGEVSP